MKKRFLLLFLIHYMISFAQISVGEKPNRKTKEFSKETFSRFLKTTTIFVLPNTIDEEIYSSILKKHWTITPFKLIDFNDFDFKNHLNNTYSFCYLNTFIKTLDKPRSINVYMYANLDVFMLNNKAIKNEKKKHKKLFLENHKISLASISLYPKNESLRPITNVRNNHKKLLDITYTKNTFYDFNAGFFTNEIQKIHSLLKEEKTYYRYKNEVSQEIKQLANNTLYIPEYLGFKFNGTRETNTNKNIDYIKELFKNYDFDYQIIKSNELSKKIIENKIDYYIKFTRVNTQRFLQVTNAKTSEVVYRKYMPG